MLIECLDDDSPYLKSEVAWALGEIGDERAAEPLINMLDEEYEFTVTNSAEALNKLGISADEILIENLDDRDVTVRKNSIYALSSVGGQNTHSVLLEIAEDRTEDKDVRRAAISALGRSEDHDMIDPLTDIMEDENEKKDVRTAVPRALLNIDKDKAITILVEDLSIENMEVRASIVSSFRKLEEDRDKVPMVIEPIGYLLQNDEEWPVRKQAAIVLADIAGEDASGYLDLALNDEHHDVRSIAANKL